MKHFTPDELQPRERTLDFIRQIAYTYRVPQKTESVVWH